MVVDLDLDVVIDAVVVAVVSLDDGLPSNEGGHHRNDPFEISSEHAFSYMQPRLSGWVYGHDSDYDSVYDQVQVQVHVQVHEPAGSGLMFVGIALPPLTRDRGWRGGGLGDISPLSKTPRVPPPPHRRTIP